MTIGSIGNCCNCYQSAYLTKEQKNANLETAAKITKQLSNSSVPPQFERSHGVTNHQILTHANILLDRGVDEFQTKTLAGLNDEQFAKAERLLDIGVDTIYVKDLAKDSDECQSKYINSQLQQAEEGLAAYNKALTDINWHGRELYKSHFAC